jgi:hypothetical protein
MILLLPQRFFPFVNARLTAFFIGADIEAGKGQIVAGEAD